MYLLNLTNSPGFRTTREQAITLAMLTESPRHKVSLVRNELNY